MKTFAAILTALFLAVTAAACGSDDGSGDPPAPPAPAGDEQLVRYKVANGLAQTERVLEIQGDGDASLSYDGKPVTFKLSEDELTELKDAVVAANFSALDDRYEQSEEVYDASVINVSSRGKEVVVLLPADPPAELQKVLDLARDHIEKHKDDPTAKQGPTTTEGRPVVPSPSDNLLAYERSGGVAGITERLFIDPSGEAIVQVGEKATRFKLSDEELDELERLIDTADFHDLDSRYGSGTVVADGFVTRVAAEGRSTTIEQPAEPPAPLADVIAFADGFVEPYR